MAATLIPYGQLANGRLGFSLEDGTGTPRASVIEVLDTLPSTSSIDNFPGRAVFSVSEATTYIFTLSPNPTWIALEGVPATVNAVNGSPPTTPIPISGSLFWDTDTNVMFIWDGDSWEPLGGRFAATFTSQTYTGDGTTRSFPMGTSNIILPSYAETFIDGVRQYPEVDFNIIGTNLEFTEAPENNTKIYIRALESNILSQNAQTHSVSITANAGDQTFDIGRPGLDPSGVFVFINGSLLTQDVDYVYNRQDTTILSLGKTTSTIALANTRDPHGIPIGSKVTINGVNEPDYLRTFEVTSTPSPTRFEFNITADAPQTATSNPIIFWSPPYINDSIRLNIAASANDIINIRSIQNAVTAPLQGEANTNASLGSGVGLVAGKTGTVNNLKTLVSGPNVTITDNTVDNEVIFSVSSVSGFEERRSINSFNYNITDESYVGVRNTTSEVRINLDSVASSTTNDGRKITIIDESGGANINNIIVSSSSSNINGSSGNYRIDSGYGYVTLVFDGNHWFITNRS